MTTKLLPIIIFFSIFFNIQLSANTDCNYINYLSVSDIRLEDTACSAEIMAKGIQTQLPIKIDNVTSIKKVYSEKNTLIFDYIVRDDISNISIWSVASKGMEKQAFLHICRNPEIRPLISAGMDVKKIYHDQKDMYLFEILIQEEGCVEEGH